MKYLLLIVIVGFVLWLMFGRDRVAKSGQRAAKTPPPALEQMVVCAHCGVHLPAADSLTDAQGRLYCSEPHRLAGPR